MCHCRFDCVVGLTRVTRVSHPIMRRSEVCDLLTITFPLSVLAWGVDTLSIYLLLADLKCFNWWLLYCDSAMKFQQREFKRQSPPFYTKFPLFINHNVHPCLLIPLFQQSRPRRNLSYLQHYNCISFYAFHFLIHFQKFQRTSLAYFHYKLLFHCCLLLRKYLLLHVSHSYMFLTMPTTMVELLAQFALSCILSPLERCHL